MGAAPITSQVDGGGRGNEEAGDPVSSGLRAVFPYQSGHVQWATNPRYSNWGTTPRTLLDQRAPEATRRKDGAKEGWL
jgi:hypothetical protein